MNDRLVMLWRWISGRCVSCGCFTPWEAWPPRRLHCPSCKEASLFFPRAATTMWPDLAQYASTCLGPDCSVTLEDDAPFCSQRCEDLFTQWADDMAAHYAHETELWELGVVS